MKKTTEMNNLLDISKNDILFIDEIDNKKSVTYIIVKANEFHGDFIRLEGVIIKKNTDAPAVYSFGTVELPTNSDSSKEFDGARIVKINYSNDIINIIEKIDFDNERLVNKLFHWFGYATTDVNQLK